MNQRSINLDVLKAIAILLVVIGHAPGLDERAAIFIYSFHVPVFFFVSGCLYKKSYTMRDVTVRLLVLYVYYIVFFGVSYAIYICKSLFYGGNELLLEPLLGLILPDGRHLYFNYTLWFLPCMMMVFVLAHFVLKLMPVSIALFGSFGAAGIVSYYGVFGLQSLPWYLNNSLIILPIYILGFRYSNQALRLMNLDKGNKLIRIVVALGLMISVFELSGLNGRVDLNGMLFGESIFLYYILALAGLLMSMLFVSILPNKKYVSKIGKNTITIYGMHPVFFAVTSLILFEFIGIPGELKSASYLISFIYIIAGLCFSVLLSPFLKRTLNVLIFRHFYR